MKSLKLSVFVLALLLGFDASWGCEEHAVHEKTTKLPSESIYHLDGTWTDQQGKVIHFGQLAGKPRIVAMVFTRCETACPLLVQNIKQSLGNLTAEQRREIEIELFSFDSGRETPKTLQAFAEKYKLDDSWSIHFGPKEEVTELAAALGVQFKKLDSGDFVHSNAFFLIGADGKIQAQQKSLSQSEAFASALRSEVAKPKTN